MLCGQRADLTQDLYSHSRAHPVVWFNVDRPEEQVAVRHLECDADAGGVLAQHAGHQTNCLKSLGAPLAHDSALADLHQAAVEFCRAADHGWVTGHGTRDVRRRGCPGVRELTWIAQAREAKRRVVE